MSKIVRRIFSSRGSPRRGRGEVRGLAFALLVFSAAAFAKKSDFLRNDEAGFELRVPKGWQSEAARADVVLFLIQPKTHQKAVVTRAIGPAQDDGSAKTLDALEAGLRGPGYARISSRILPLKKGGRQRAYDLWFRRQGHAMAARFLLFPSYSLALVIDDGTKPALEKAAARMLESFRPTAR